MGLVYAVVDNAAVRGAQAVALHPLLLLQAASEHEVRRPAQQWRVNDHLPFVSGRTEIRGIDHDADDRSLLAQLPGDGLSVEKGIEIHARHVRDVLFQGVALEPAQSRKRELAATIQMDRGQVRIETPAQGVGRVEVSQMNVVTR